MTRIRKHALMPYSPAQMFDVVNSVADYPAFLPWCLASKVLFESDTEMLASIELGKGPVQRRFTTRNRLDYPRSIRVQLERGPFETLSGEWLFSEVGDMGCKVEMDLAFELKGGLSDRTLGLAFGQIAGSLVEAFCDRAERLYG